MERVPDPLSHYLIPQAHLEALHSGARLEAPIGPIDETKKHVGNMHFVFKKGGVVGRKRCCHAGKVNQMTKNDFDCT